MNPKNTPKENARQTFANTVKDWFRDEKYELVASEVAKHITEKELNVDLLLLKMKAEERLQKYDEALKTCNFILFFRPTNLEAHQTKINILKHMQRYNYLSNSLVYAKRLFPNLTFS